jgi:hypothetical protein
MQVMQLLQQQQQQEEDQQRLQPHQQADAATSASAPQPLPLQPDELRLVLRALPLLARLPGFEHLALELAPPASLPSQYRPHVEEVPRLPGQEMVGGSH